MRDKMVAAFTAGLVCGGGPILGLWIWDSHTHQAPVEDELTYTAPVGEIHVTEREGVALAYLTGVNGPYVIPPCESEDDQNLCVWDASNRGNDVGQSFIHVEDGLYLYFDSTSIIFTVVVID